MTRTAFQSIAVLLVSALPWLAACAEQAEQVDQAPTAPVIPVTDMTAASGPGNGDGWIALGSTPGRPALSLYEDRRPVLVLTCEGMQMHVQARGFEPRQAWPQPVMVVRFGDASRSAAPDVRNIGTQIAYELEFRIADDVTGAIRKSAPVIVDFNDQSRTLRPIPEDQARGFADRCDALVPAGLRQAGTGPRG